LGDGLRLWGTRIFRLPRLSAITVIKELIMPKTEHKEPL
jgi:hypothetical protein